MEFTVKNPEGSGNVPKPKGNTWDLVGCMHACVGRRVMCVATIGNGKAKKDRTDEQDSRRGVRVHSPFAQGAQLGSLKEAVVDPWWCTCAAHADVHQPIWIS